jgi:hypothetical protein
MRNPVGVTAFLLATNAFAAGSDISGTVKGARGPEAGVWVIAETTDLPTRFARIVVTDDAGRYLIPDLPRANYNVWVRGYGLVDSAKLRAIPGQKVDHAAVTAPDERSAAQYYPAIHWYSMLKIPEASEFGGHTSIPRNLTQKDWVSMMGNRGCVGCHQMGQASTRTLPAQFADIPESDQAWIRRVQSGQAGQAMVQNLGFMGGAPYKYFADWTDRVAKGELPHTRPQRPKGLERNIVVTWWEWADQKRYLHDLIASDRRFPTVNAYGPLFGNPEHSTDDMPILDPKTHKVTFFKLPVRDADTPEALGPGYAGAKEPLQPSPYWGGEKIWDSKANNHNAMFGRDGRVWLAASVRNPANQDFCKKGSAHPSAKVFPTERTNRHVAVLDPKTMKYTFVDTCFSTHHLQFDGQDRLWTSGAPVAGWIDTRAFDKTGDAVASQGWSPFVLDLNGTGQRDEWTEPNQPADEQKDRRLPNSTYAVMPHLTDGSVWYTTLGPALGGLLRYDTKTQLTEFYRVPLPGHGLRGGDIDKKGVVWVSLGSGHLGSFDRSKCKAPLNGPKATGDHCPEGWAFHQYPGPGFQGIGPNSAEASYYTWVDQHNTLGLGEDVPMSTANLQDGLVAMKDGQMILMRVPYPLGFYAKGFDGRIDDPKAGWKGRGLWTASGDRTPWLREGGKGSLPLAVHFQLRPDPLAR